MGKIIFRSYFILLLLVLSKAQLMSQGVETPYADFFVSTKGNDLWSGKLSEPNETNTDGPFATIKRAKLAVRLIKKDLYRNIFVLIREGEYHLTEAEVFNTLDSHHDSFQIVYKAYPNEKPVFSSDQIIEDWQLAKSSNRIPAIAKGKVYVAKLPALPAGKSRFYTLYDRGKLLTRAHSKGFEPTKVMTGGDGGGIDWKGLIAGDRNTLWYPSKILKNWENLEDIEIFVQPNVGYVTNYLTLASVDEKLGIAKTVLPATYPMGKIDKHLHAMEGGGSCRVENAIEYLDSPGEWVINTKEKLVYYWPENDIPGQVTFPLLSNYILVDGHATGGIVKNIAFKDLTFTRGEREVVTSGDIGLQHEWDMWNKSNALVQFRDVESCELSNCRLTNSASAGVRLDLYAQSNLIKNNLIDYVGGTGILLSGYGPGKLNVNKSNRILNNQIHHCGEFYYQSNGIMLFQSGENIIQNNKLHHLPYDAVVLSGTRPMFFLLKGQNREQVGSIRTDEIAPETLYYDDSLSNYSNFIYYKQWPKTSPYFHTKNNIVEDNEVFLVMQKCFDGNAIYLSDVGDGNIIRRNYIHHLNGVGMQQAIRTDAFIKNTTITENVIYNCNGGGINLKYYENNAYNNIIADIHDIVYKNSTGKINRMFIGYFSLMDVFTRDKMPPYTNCHIANNIIYKVASHNTFFRQGNVNGRLTELKIEECNLDKNLYYDVNLYDHGKSALAYYQSRGADKNSIVADPMFRDIKNGDFRLNENSPAYKIGFKDIDFKRIGLTTEFPNAFIQVVKSQLGADYDNFNVLEVHCKQTIQSADKEFKEADGI